MSTAVVANIQGTHFVDQPSQRYPSDNLNFALNHLFSMPESQASHFSSRIAKQIRSVVAKHVEGGSLTDVFGIGQLLRSLDCAEVRTCHLRIVASG